jgi:hypothetical protein
VGGRCVEDIPGVRYSSDKVIERKNYRAGCGPPAIPVWCSLSMKFFAHRERRWWARKSGPVIKSYIWYTEEFGFTNSNSCLSN